MKRNLSCRVNLAISPGLRKCLEIEARTRSRSLSSTVRVLLQEALGLSTLDRDEYDVYLTSEEAARLVELGYYLVATTGYKQLRLPEL